MSFYSEPGEPHPIVLGGAVLAFVVVAVLAVFMTITSCKGTTTKTFTVGMNTPFPPFDQREGEVLTGFDVDLANAISSKLGKTLVLKDYDEFDSLLPTLAAKKIDAVISATTITNDRKEIASFSDPYFDASQAILVFKSNGFTYGTPADLSGKRIAYQAGTTSEDWVKGNVIGKVSITSAEPFPDVTVGIQFLQLHSVDAIIIDEPAANALVKTSRELTVIGKIDTGEHYGVAVSPGDPEGLLPTINKVIADMKANGQYDRLVQKWFGAK